MTRTLTISRMNPKKRGIAISGRNAVVVNSAAFELLKARFSAILGKFGCGIYNVPTAIMVRYVKRVLSSKLGFVIRGPLYHESVDQLHRNYANNMIIIE